MDTENTDGVWRYREIEANRAPIMGTPGAHPVGTGLGAAGGAVAGAAIGAIGGPVGAAVGVVGGAVAGAIAGKKIAEAMETPDESAGRGASGSKDGSIAPGALSSTSGPAFPMDH